MSGELRINGSNERAVVERDSDETIELKDIQGLQSTEYWNHLISVGLRINGPDERDYIETIKLKNIQGPKQLNRKHLVSVGL